MTLTYYHPHHHLLISIQQASGGVVNSFHMRRG